MDRTDRTDGNDMYKVQQQPAAATEAQWFAVAGAGLLGLASLFLWKDLGVRAEFVLVPAAMSLTAAGLMEVPRSRPLTGLIGLLACALVGTAWYALCALSASGPVTTSDVMPLLAGIGLSLAGSVAIAATTWRRSVLRGDDERAAYVIYALVAIVLLVTPALYYQLFTVGVAEENVARRLVLTLAWLIAGVAMVLLGHGRRELRLGGCAFVFAAVAKAVAYDATHLEGALRIAVLGVSGLILLGGSFGLRSLGRAREAARPVA